VPSVRTLRDKILRRALMCTIVPNLYELNAVYTAVWGRERLFIKLLLFLCARILILNAAATFLLAFANERVFVHFS
jgi:hypothetical protein